MSSVPRSDGQLISSTMQAGEPAHALTSAAANDGRTLPLISVVMAAYNAVSTLDRAIESLLAQSESSWELVIVNDGSTDDTAAAAASWASRDRRIRVVNQSNMGASHARNRGISEACGHWIVFLDSDDTLDRRHFRLMLKAVASAPGAGAAACGWVRVDKGGRRTMSVIPTKERFSVEYIYANGPPTVIHAYLLPRLVLLREGGFDVRFKTGEDWDLWIRLARLGLQFAVVPKILAVYWDSGGSLTKDLTQVIRDDMALRELARMPDPRISSPLPEHANGLRRELPHEDFLVSVMFWSATRLGGGQSPPNHLFELLEPFHPSHALPTPWAIAEMICSGLEMLSPGGREGIAAHWPHFSANLWVFLQAFEAWARTPGIATAVLYEVELECLKSARFHGAVTLTHTIGVNFFSLSPLRGVSGPPTIDRVIVLARTGKSARVVANIPFFEPMSGMRIQAAIFRRMLRRVERKALGFGFIPGCLRRMGRLSAVVYRIESALGLKRQRARALPVPLAGIVDEEKRKVEASGLAVTPPPSASTGHPDEETAAGWDRFYEHEDPWDYGSGYEQQKYEDTLELVPSVAGAALEIACSEGRFTERLAAKAGRVLAVDISSNALARAARRCSRFPNVEFRQTDVFKEELSGTWSLIVCSEVLYYLPDKASLLALVDRLFRATEPGGYFVHAHARSVDDDPSRTGFDWGVPFGSDFIAEVLSQAGFVRIRTIDREVYRVDLFQKPPVSMPAAGAETLTRPVSGMPPRVAGGVVWGGAIQTRAKLDAVRRSRVPVLAYHRIASTGPDFLAPWRVTPEQFEQQLIFLRRRGYQSCSPADMITGAERSGSLQGRRVMITFDDGYTDFYETAWPILQRNGFSAHNFIVTEQVGGHAEWDGRWGAPAPLMTWDQIVHLSAEGATFGSHLASHTAATHLRSAALFREAVNSRLKLEQVLGVPIDTIATPFGESSGLVEVLLREAGYRQHFGNHMDCFAPVSSNWMSIPRLFVTSDLDIHAFARLMRLTFEPPEAADRLPMARLAS